MVKPKYPVALLWTDLETDRLIPDPVDQVIDLHPLNIMEVGFIVTDFELRPISGYSEALKMTPEIAQGLRENPDVLEMHRENGLIQACIESPHTLADVEQEVVAMIQEIDGIEPGNLQIAGSGVARFDQTIIQAKMPELARFLHYAPYDVGVLRRTSKTMARQDVVNIPRSYRDGQKAHRAYADAEAHLEEAQRFQEFFQRAVSLGAHLSPES